MDQQPKTIITVSYALGPLTVGLIDALRGQFSRAEYLRRLSETGLASTLQSLGQYHADNLANTAAAITNGYAAAREAVFKLETVHSNGAAEKPDKAA